MKLVKQQWLDIVEEYCDRRFRGYLRRLQGSVVYGANIIILCLFSARHHWSPLSDLNNTVLTAFGLTPSFLGQVPILLSSAKNLKTVCYSSCTASEICTLCRFVCARTDNTHSNSGILEQWMQCMCVTM